MATPDFVLALREKIGSAPLWLSGVTAVVVRQRSDATEVLLVRRSDTGAWTPVTGIIDPGEEPAVAGAREVLEEAAIEAVPERLVLVSVSDPIVYANGDHSQYLDLTFRFRYVDGDPYPADGENTEARWFGIDTLPPLSADMLRRVDAACADEPEAIFAF